MTEAPRHFILLPSYFFLSDRRVPPGECGFTSSDGNPGTNGVISKARCGALNKDEISNFASRAFGSARTCPRPPQDGFAVANFESGDMSPQSKRYGHCSIRSSGNSFVSWGGFGNSLASTLPISLTASIIASLNLSF